MRVKPGPATAALALCLLFASPAGAAESAGPQFKAEIDGFLQKLGATTNGLVKWEGADRTDIREEGGAAIADLTNARISIGSEENKPTAKRAQITFDHVEVHSALAPDGARKLSFVLPQRSTVDAPDHGQATLTLKDATGSIVIDTKSGRVRESEAAFASARIDDKATGDWVTFGPLSLASKVAAAAAGGWTGPISFELKQMAFFDTHGPASGAIDRITYSAHSAGPDLAGLNRLRDRIDALRQQDLPPDQKRDETLALLPDLISMFSEARGELTIEGLVARGPSEQPLVALKKASIAGALTGLSGDTAAWRITVKHDGLSLAPTVLDPAKVPHHAVVDIGLEDVGTGALRNIVEAIGKLRQGASDADKQQAEQQVMAAAATLNPTFRIYDLTVDTPDAGVAATGEAKGSPLLPKGYTAAGDVNVRGFDTLAGLLGPAPPAAYLPLLKEIGTSGKADDGSPRLKFHLASTPQQPITLNGNDVSAWFAGGKPPAGQPRDLRPAEPVMTGADVSAVQQALAAAHIAAPQNGTYDGATAAAVARFQKANALNVNGVVDAKTRQKLGVKPAATGAN